jgi:hypothetical protein
MVFKLLTNNLFFMTTKAKKDIVKSLVKKSSGKSCDGKGGIGSKYPGIAQLTPGKKTQPGSGFKPNPVDKFKQPKLRMGGGMKLL